MVRKRRHKSLYFLAIFCVTKLRSYAGQNKTITWPPEMAAFKTYDIHDFLYMKNARTNNER